MIKFIRVYRTEQPASIQSLQDFSNKIGGAQGNKNSTFDASSQGV